MKSNKNVSVKYFRNTAPFLSYNDYDKNDNHIELHLLKTFRSDQNLNYNLKKKTMMIAIEKPIKTFSIKTARKYVIRGEMRVSSKYDAPEAITSAQLSVKNSYVAHLVAQS